MNGPDPFLEPGVLVKHPSQDDWGLGQVQTVTGAGEATGLGDGNKGIEVGQIHGGIPVSYPKHEKYEFELFNVTP